MSARPIPPLRRRLRGDLERMLGHRRNRKTRRWLRESWERQKVKLIEAGYFPPDGI